jgi:hypothetical protein
MSIVVWTLESSPDKLTSSVSNESNDGPDCGVYIKPTDYSINFITILYTVFCLDRDHRIFVWNPVRNRIHLSISERPGRDVYVKSINRKADCGVHVMTLLYRMSEIRTVASNALVYGQAGPWRLRKVYIKKGRLWRPRHDSILQNVWIPDRGVGCTWLYTSTGRAVASK